MGFNAIRFIWGGAERYHLDLCDELGLLVYEESFASSGMDESPKMVERFGVRARGQQLRTPREGTRPTG